MIHWKERDPSRWYNLIESGMYKNGLKEGVWSHLAGSNFITENYLHGRKNGLAYEYENERDYLDRQPPYLVKTTTYRNDTSIAERNYIVDSGGTRFISSVSGLPGGNQVDSMYNYDPPKKTDLGKSYFSRNNFEMNRLDDEFILPGMEALVILSYKDYHLVHRKSFYKSGKLFSDCTYPFRKDSFYIKGEGSMQHSFSRTVRFDSIGKWNVWYENGNPYLEGTIKMFDGFNDPSYIYTSELQMLSESSWIVRDINGNIIEERTYHEGVLEKRIKKH